MRRDRIPDGRATSQPGVLTRSRLPCEARCTGVGQRRTKWRGVGETKRWQKSGWRKMLSELWQHCHGNGGPDSKRRRLALRAAWHCGQLSGLRGAGGTERLRFPPGKLGGSLGRMLCSVRGSSGQHRSLGESLASSASPPVLLRIGAAALARSQSLGRGPSAASRAASRRGRLPPRLPLDRKGHN